MLGSMRHLRKRLPHDIHSLNNHLCVALRRYSGVSVHAANQQSQFISIARHKVIAGLKAVPIAQSD